MWYIAPGHFTDSCSSHPLYVADELEEKDAVGVKRAALRRLQAELGIPQTRKQLSCGSAEPCPTGQVVKQISIKDIIFMNRIYQKSPSDDIWGDHEIGYLLLVRKDLMLHPDAREVGHYCFMSREEVQELLDRGLCGEEKITPWFRSIVEGCLGGFI